MQGDTIMDIFVEDLDLIKKRNYQITKSNQLIQKTRYTLSTQQQKVLLFIIQKIQPNDKEFQTYEISLQDYCKIAGIEPTNGKNYQNIRASLKALRDKSFWITLDNGKETPVSWLNKVWVDPDKSTIEIRLDEDLKPYLLQLKSFFVSYNFYYVLAMRSQYSIRLYELLKSYENLSGMVFELKDLRKLLNLDEGKMERWVDMKRFVIEKAIEEINLLTDLIVEYEPIKQGRAVHDVKFSMRKKSLEKILDSEIQIEKRINPKRAEQLEKASKIEVPLFNWLEDLSEIK